MVGIASALSLAFCGQAVASTLDLDETAAAVAAPIITGGSSVSYSADAATFITVTNAGDAVRLHMNVISGDRDDDWQSQNFDCLLTASETVLFVFTDGNDHKGSSYGDSGSDLYYECDEGVEERGYDEENLVWTPMITRNGIMFISIEDPISGATLNSNQIFADWVVVDYNNGMAFSAGAIAFQGAVPDGGIPDRKYRFDGVEYAQFPAALATNFLAPDYDINGHLILFSLDGTAGSGSVPASVSIKFYNDDEVGYSAGYSFDCFSIVSLKSIDPRFHAEALGSMAGHLVLTPDLVNYPDLAHDSQFDGGGVLGVRKSTVHGWLVQTIDAEGEYSNDSFMRSRNNAAWARTLAQSTLPLQASNGDTPTFNGR
jgi:hypothetical protein